MGVRGFVLVLVACLSNVTIDLTKLASKNKNSASTVIENVGFGVKYDGDDELQKDEGSRDDYRAAFYSETVNVTYWIEDTVSQVDNTS